MTNGRNLLIYLDATAQRRALETLRRLLRMDGLLFVGYAEHGPVQACGFKMLPFPRASAFVGADRIGMIRPIPSLPLARTDQGRYRHEKFPPSLPPPNLPLAKGEELDSPKWCEGEKTLAYLSLDDIRRLADQGQIHESLKQCEHYLRAHPPSAEAYYLLGLLLDAHNRPEQAEQSLRKAIYLQSDHHQAIAELGGLLKRRGETQAAAHFLARARRAEGAAQQPAGQALTGDFSYRSKSWKARR